jgi:hypothetical protein
MLGKMGYERLLVGSGEHLEALGGVIESVVVKVARDGEVGFVGNRTLAGDIKPTFTDAEALKPVAEKLIGDSLIAELSHGGHADLGASEGSGRPVDGVAGTVFVGE